jgi:hypothetical protein
MREREREKERERGDMKDFGDWTLHFSKQASSHVLGLPHPGKRE